MSRLMSSDRLSEKVRRISVDLIKESPFTLRTEYNAESLKELGESLVQRGQLQTVVVQPGEKGHYELVIGSRRLKAAKLKGVRDIAVYIIEKRNPVELLFIALAENLHRDELNPFEEAQAFLRLMKEYKVTVKSIAKGINKPEGYIRNRLQLLSMPDEVLTMVAEQKLPVNAVRTLARLPTGEHQVRMAELVSEHHLSQSELSAQIRRELQEKPLTRSAYELTPLKVQAHISEFAIFLQKVPRRMKMRRMNAVEKQSLFKSLQMLEEEVQSLQKIVRDCSLTSFSPMRPHLQKSDEEPNNHGQEWPAGDIQRIHSAHRPSDEELAEELGRTVSAIKAMRAKASESR